MKPRRCGAGTSRPGRAARTAGSARRRASAGATIAALVLLLGAPGPSLWAAPGYTLIRTAVLPPTFYVGDRVELRVRIQPEKGRRIEAPTSLPTDRWVRIDSIEVAPLDTDVEVRIFLESYMPGRTPLPPIKLGDISLSGLSIDTASLVSGVRTGLREPKGQLFLPDSGLLLALAIGILFGLPPLVYFSARWVRRFVVGITERREFARPWKRLVVAIDRLAKQGGEPRAFYFELSDEIRRYLCARGGADFMSATSRELAPLLGGAFPALPAALEASAVVSYADQVKFAGIRAGAGELARDVGRARAATRAIEERARADREAALRSRRRLARRPLARRPPAPVGEEPRAQL